MNLKEAKAILTKIVNKNVKIPVLILGPPGIGKTAISKQVAEEQKLPAFIFEGSSLDPTDVRGLLVIAGDKTIFSKSALYPTEERGIFLIDEIGFATPAVQRALNALFLERRLGTDKIPDSIFIFGTGNPPEYGGFPLLSTTINRCIILKTQPDLQIWLEAVEVHPIIRAYLRLKPHHFYTYEGDDKPFASPRSWDYVSQLIVADICDEEVFAGLLGPKVASDFWAFFSDEALRNLDIEEILKKQVIPELKTLLYLVESLCDCIKKEMHLDAIFKYGLVLAKSGHEDLAYALYRTAAEKCPDKLFSWPGVEQIYKLYGKSFMLDHMFGN